MAQQIQYTSLAPTTRTANLTEEDMAALYDVVADQFLASLPHLELNSKTTSWMPERLAIRNFAEKYGVAFDHPPSLEAFFRAALGRAKSE
jgi:hypothetical protein